MLTSESIGKNAKHLNVDNSWNKDGLLASRKETDGDVVFCANTIQPLFYKRENGQRVLLAPYGQCYNCEKYFHESQLNTSDGADRSSYPVIYLGLWCKECCSIPMSQWRQRTEDE